MYVLFCNGFCVFADVCCVSSVLECGLFLGQAGHVPRCMTGTVAQKSKSCRWDVFSNTIPFQVIIIIYVFI